MGADLLSLADEHGFAIHQRDHGRGGWRSTTAERHLAAGQLSYHRAGAYPWALVDAGKLPADWPADPQIGGRFRCWWTAYTASQHARGGHRAAVCS
jgi:hypothetical protein